jgi:hypothetical protein
MAVAKHGVTSNTPDRLLLDAGAIYTGFTSVASPGTLLGATKGGAVFEVKRNIRDVRPDGAKGPVKGFRRIEDVVATLKVTLLEITEANLLLALPGAAAVSHVITGAEIDDSDYISKVALVATISGFDMTAKPIILELSNVLVTSPLSIKTGPNDETTIELTFEAHYSDSDLDTEPWSITYPA